MDVVVPVAAAFGAGALAGAVIVATLHITGLLEWPVGAIGWLIVWVGLGMSVGPLPVPRLLLRLPPGVLALIAAAVAAAAAIASVASGAQLVILPSLLILGLAVGTLDSLRGTWLRRLANGGSYPSATRTSLAALTAGQIVGALAIGLGSDAVGPAAALVIVALGHVLLVAAAVSFGGRSSLHIGSLSRLPVKSVVHELSWETRPEALEAEPRSTNPRVRRLARWINREVNLQRLSVTLPVSGREYEIYRPSDESRERLFEQGRADPEKQMPYWAKVWPSGVALADVVVERSEEVRGSRVLELGAGLGVTACAILENGGELMTADYAALPLAHCRLNTLVNTGRAARATCFNWRHDAEVRAVVDERGFKAGFPLIVGGDLLYEGRDAEPLLNVVERLLTPDGQLWLAEPVRRTAQRFLDAAAERGWEIDSRQVQANWPDATDGPVNLHFLRRSQEPDRIATDLGGWRI